MPVVCCVPARNGEQVEVYHDGANFCFDVYDAKGRYLRRARPHMRDVGANNLRRAKAEAKRIAEGLG